MKVGEGWIRSTGAQVAGAGAALLLATPGETVPAAMLPDEKGGAQHTTGGYVTFATTQGESILVKVGLSFVGEEKARANLETEIPDWDFEAVRDAARSAWNRKLEIIQVEGGTGEQRTNFYSSLYRCLQWPPVRSDVDGQYMGLDGKVHDADWTHYGLPPMWDVYRNKQPLLTLIEPEIKRQILRGLVERAETQGWMDTYNHGNQPDHHAPYLYNYVGQPWKTQQRVREIMDKMYRGLVYTGMDDCGEMAAWYVWSAIGCYPVCPPDRVYPLGSPVFEKVTVQLPAFYGGHRWVVEARDVSDSNCYIQSATLNGEAWNRPYVTFDHMSRSGTLVLNMGPEPNQAWGGEPGE